MKQLFTIIIILSSFAATGQNYICYTVYDTFPAKLMVQDVRQDKPVITLGYKIMRYKSCSQSNRHDFVLIALLDRKKKRFPKNIIAVETK